jgi:hypothetical protein
MERTERAELQHGLRSATDQYRAALAARSALSPGDPGYRAAVQHLGVRWSRVQWWRRRMDEAARDIR